MASNWVGGTGGSETDVNIAANWNPSGVPGATAEILVGINTASSYSMTGSLATFDASTGQTWRVGPKMTGSIATAGAAMQIGTGTTLDWRGIHVPYANFDIQTCTKARIRETFGAQQCLVFSAGTLTELIADAAQGLLLGNGLTVTTARMLQALALVEAGVTIVTWEQSGGQVNCYSTPTNIIMAGGTFTHLNPSTATNTLLRMFGGVFVGEASGQTYSEFDLWGGVVNGENMPAATVSAGRVRRGAVCNLQNGADNIVAALTKLGGVIRGGANVVVTEDISSPLAA